MNILYITAENIFGTGSSNIRNVSLIVGLMRNGHTVDILTLEVNRNARKFDETIEEILSKNHITFLKNRSLQKQFAISKTKHTNVFTERIKLFAYRALKSCYVFLFGNDTLSDAVNRVDESEFPENKFDLIISSSDPVSSHILAMKYMQAKGRVKWYQYWGDPLYSDITRKDRNRSKLKKVERGFLMEADKVVYTNPMTLAEQIKLFPELSRRFNFVPTPFLFAENYEPAQEVIYDYGYFGSYMKCVRNILPLCNAVNKEKKKLLVVGGGDQEVEQSEWVSVLPYQPTSVVSKLEAECRVLVCLCNQSISTQKCTQLPGKIYHYAMTNNPILVIGADDETREFLSKYNRFSFSENTLEAIQSALSMCENNAELINQPIGQWKCDVVAHEFISE